MEAILDLLKNLPHELYIIVISAIPVIEVRGAIPVGIFTFKMDPAYVLFLSILGSMIPVPFILLFITRLIHYLKTTKLLAWFAHWLERKTKGKNVKDIEKYGLPGLSIFVGVPLPGTGVWTGSLIAAAFEFRFWRALLAVFIGDLIAGIIVTLICTGALGFLKFLVP